VSGNFLGIDIGTTGTKIALFDPHSGSLVSCSAPSPLYSDRPGWSEADSAIWWELICKLVPQVLDSAGVAASDIGGVACSGMVPAVLFLDRGGTALRRPMLQNDARAVKEIDELAIKLAALNYPVLEKTGSALTQQSVAPTWRWMRANEPDVVGATSSIAGSYDWLAMTLGAQRHVEENWAIESGLYELTGGLANPVLEAAGLPAEDLPVVRRAGERIGEVTRAAAEATSLAVGTPLYVGGADHVLAAFAAGLCSPGQWLIKLGGGGDILAVADRAVVDARLYLDVHPAPGLWLPNGCMATSGSLLRWMQHILGDVELSLLDEEAAKSPPAEIVCLPYFLGEKSPLHDPNLRGCFVGLHLGHERADLFRSCLEAVAFGFRDHLGAFHDAGVTMDNAPRVSNGGSGSRLWKQILADVLDVSLFPVVDHEGAAFGAALVAAVGAGAIVDWADAARFARIGAPVMPRPEYRSAYNEGFEIYRDLQQQLTTTSHRLAMRQR
jgi:xylulokinase